MAYMCSDAYNHHAPPRPRYRRILHALSNSAVILALRAGIPRLVCTDSDTAQPLTVGFHGLRPLNDGNGKPPHPRYRRTLHALTLMHVIQRERKRPKNPPVGCTG